MHAGVFLKYFNSSYNMNYIYMLFEMPYRLGYKIVGDLLIIRGVGSN